MRTALVVSIVLLLAGAAPAQHKPFEATAEIRIALPGDVPPRVSITDKSGVDGIALWVNAFLGLEGDSKLSKIKVHKVARWVMDQYETHGRMSAITDDELAEQVKEHLPDQYAARVKKAS